MSSPCLDVAFQAHETFQGNAQEAIQFGTEHMRASEINRSSELVLNVSREEATQDGTDIQPEVPHMKSLQPNLQSKHFDKA